jgi:hypothetical protein
VNRGTLPIAARLRSLQAASRFAPGGGRIIADVGDRNPLAHLLRATNETMLGRSLQFDSDSGASLTLDVAGRRVLRLTAAIGLPGADSCLGVEVLEDEHKDDLIKLLQAIAAPRHQLRVTSGPIGRGGEEVSVGLPVALLADLVLIDLNEIGSEDPEQDEPQIVEPEPKEPEPSAPVLAEFDEELITETGSGASLADFAQGFGPELLAWLIVGGGSDGMSSGPDEMVSHLKGFLDDEHDSLDRQLDLLATAPGSPVCVMLGASLIEGHSIVCVRVQPGLLLGVIEGDGTRAALHAWRRAMA